MNYEISDYFFPDFRYPFCYLTRFLQADNLFTILLKDGNVTHFKPANVPDFRNWLTHHDIEDIKESIQKDHKLMQKK
ncbi:hypothetical protein [Dyadobacter sediminis]|uniref:Uncharacterized protein n=1 Tax=Dyadobacter sediminis TaxID=1493691 RepID=A0A5R9KJU1_9BACT|nr:hypothetical protein [Dyadobacter sediminis]TLU96336.1 hypothetical protein FEM55_04130 [Dyadobacter sediminis]GGB81403.1 hypothetical protein GCM10011325_06080 [Dyadobacter sediminis]